MAKKSGKRKKDYRVRMIKYALNHPLTPRPLKFGTMRMLRHWTIHRAWHLYQREVRTSRTQELERQYNYMRDACEELKKCDERLYRIATSKKGTGYFPVELRIPTDTPPRGGWDHAWVRPVVVARK
ncbi:mitochondrial ribosomal protein L28-domain-containing protein [Peziza echinospora]|nr:mitochondrial ribosomal protein L28-domain-containing protein [Peziza echinospora]